MEGKGDYFRWQLVVLGGIHCSRCSALLTRSAVPPIASASVSLSQVADATAPRSSRRQVNLCQW